MSEPSIKDPAEVWRDMVAQWEKGFNAIANQAMGSEQFSQMMHRATSASAGVQQTVGDLMGRYLAALNLPSRAEMTAIGERLQAIEASLARIEMHLGRSSASGTVATAIAVPRPPRTRKPAPKADARSDTKP